MSPHDAARLLEIPADATPEQIEARFLELRNKLEEKIGKAPTPGLKAKYRESLEEITKAFETLTLAADSSALPVLRREQGEGSREKEERGQTADDSLPRRSLGEGGRTEDGGPGERTATAKRKSGSREFVIVAAIAVVVLAGGGWWVMKTRAENAEKARIAAEQKAEAERQTEAKKRAEEEEKARVAAEQKAGQERVEKLTATIRSKIAELRIAWDALEQEARQLERKTGELKSEERNLNNNLKGQISPELLELRANIAGHEELSAWLGQQLLRHPAKVARVQGEELLSARQVDDSAATIARAAEEQARFEAEFEENRKLMLTLTVPITITSETELTKWTLTDAWGRQHTGEGRLGNRALPAGPLEAEFTASGFKPRTQMVTLQRGQPQTIEAGIKPARVTIESHPAGAEVWLRDKRLGVTPYREGLFTPGNFELEVRHANFPARKITLRLDEGDEPREELIFLSSDSGVAGFTYEHDIFGFEGENNPHYHVIVKEVTPGGPADRAGLKPDDSIGQIIRSDDPVPDVSDMDSPLVFAAAMGGSPGETRKLIVYRGTEGGMQEGARHEIELTLAPFAELQRLEAAAARAPQFPTPESAHVNSLGMRFVPVPGTASLFSIWETRVQDFEAFVRATGHDTTAGGMWSLRRGNWAQQGDTWQNPGYPQGPTHPVVGVTHADAEAFCRWLTEKERREGRLREDQEYRLPYDWEWSAANEPAEFPWGHVWPPPRTAGNLAGSEARDADWPSGWNTLSNHTDPHPRSAPVGSYPANRHGIFDLAGNVVERVSGRANGLRGASFNYGTTRETLAVTHQHNGGAGRGFSVGFRVVLQVGWPPRQA